MAAAAVIHVDLLERCVAGDAGAWDELLRQYQPHARAFLRRLGVPPPEAEDACQEVFVQVFRYLPRFERRADFRTWLYKLCISQAARVRRRAALRRPLAWLGLAAPAAAPEWSASRAVELCDRALAAMGARHRAAFVLFELEGLGGAEVARALGVPEASARRMIQEARRLFEDFVREEPFGDRR
jgi:RNA polymerase sigma-70 factor (ECF subfamily)